MRLVESLTVAALISLATDSLAADAQQGRFLYETYCGTCHFPKLHDRTASRMDTLARLKSEVQRWSAETGRSFTPAEIDDLVDYLNRSHYRLAK